jgi:hypothetical protein
MSDPISSALGDVTSAVESIGGTATQELGQAAGLIQQLTSFRAVPPLEQVATDLGSLALLAGRWRGRGFNLIARPDFQGTNPLFLELNLTEEELDFSPIGSPIPNRGFGQNDINLFGLTYLQQISDATDEGALHIEPGIWINVPATTDPPESASVTRLATIPHGNAVCIEGTGFSVAGPPKFRHANTVPFRVGAPDPAPGAPNAFPEYDLSKPTLFRTNPLPAGITQAMVNDPNIVLENIVAKQRITNTVVLNIGTVSSFTVAGSPPETVPIPNGGGGSENIPFVQKNADVPRVTATFWIETVQRPKGGSFLQLQYTQTVLLNFPVQVTGKPQGPNLSWPHVTVATLVKRFGS